MTDHSFSGNGEAMIDRENMKEILRLHRDGYLSSDEVITGFFESIAASQPVATGEREAFEAGFAAYWGPQSPDEVEGFVADMNRAWDEYRVIASQPRSEGRSDELEEWKQVASVEAGLRREFLARAEKAEAALAEGRNGEAQADLMKLALRDIISWKEDVLGDRTKPRGPYDCAPEITEAFDRGARMAFYRCASRAALAISSLSSTTRKGLLDPGIDGPYNETCEHKSAHDGPRVDVRWGSAPTQVCDCGMWRTMHHAPGPWRADPFPSQEGKS